MKLWTIQPLRVYETLKKCGTFQCDPSLSVGLAEMDFVHAYDWLAEQMKLRIGNPPGQVKYPIWAWHTFNWKHAKPDLRCSEFRSFKESHVCLELIFPDSSVVLSDEEAWHYVLNNSYLDDSKNEVEWEEKNSYFNSLPPDRKEMALHASWNHIFDISPFENSWVRRGCYIQATFWELHIDQVVRVKYFGRPSATP